MAPAIHQRSMLAGTQPSLGMGTGEDLAPSSPSWRGTGVPRGGQGLLLSPHSHLLLLALWPDFLYLLLKMTLSFPPVADNWKPCILLLWAEVGTPVVLTQALQVWMQVRSCSWVHPRCSERVLAFASGGWIKLVDNLIGVLNPYGNKSCAALSCNTFIASLELLKAVMLFPCHWNKISVPCGYYRAEYSGFLPGWSPGLCISASYCKG